MKSPSKRKALRRLLNRVLLGLGLVLSGVTFSVAQEKNNLFDVIPPGDPAYGQLQSLAQVGWVSQKDIAAPSLTRFEVAELILKAEAKSDDTMAAPPSQDDSAQESDDDDTLLPPPEETSGPAAATGPVTQTPAQESAALAEAAKSLHSLEEAHQYELKEVADKLKAVQTNADNLDAAQYDLRKQLKGIEQSPSISIHGLGRGFGIYQQYSGNYSGVSIVNPDYRETEGFLDLQPTAAISKEIRFDSIFRIESSLEPNDVPLFQIRRMTLHFDPSWFSATLGDFDESYTPLVLWNRDNLDLRYTPEMYARWDDRSKYESFLNNEPNWPFRGLRVGVDVMWLDPSILSELKASAFLHMIRNGFNDTAVAGSGMYFGPNQYTDWVFGGQLELDTQKMFLGGAILDGSLKSHGLILDEPLDTDAPGSAYNPGDPSTWAHQYLLGSLKPEMNLRFGDFVFGGDFEWSSARYQDDKRNQESLFNDFALLGGPHLKLGNSSLSVNYLNVGPYYYAPLAQTRQDAVTNLSSIQSPISPDLFEPALRSQYFLSSLPRAGGIFSFYNRLQDNTFPYGLATPNREGFGLELDVKALEKDILKIRGSAYLVKEISGNLVVDAPATGFTPVDSPTGGTLVPIRQFTYVNVGPSINLGPALGWNGDLEVGVNGRYEQTTSDLGTLTSLWVLGGIRADLLPVWEVAAAYGFQQAQGDEAGISGTYYARYSYLYDNSDLGSYSVFHVDGSEQSLRLSNAFLVNRNSKIYLDWDWAWGDLAPIPVTGNILNQFVEMSYEIQF